MRPRSIFALLALWLAGAAAPAAGAPASQHGPEGPATILVVFDSSYSMGHWLYDRAKLDIAKDGVREVLGRLDRDTVVGLRALAHEEGADPCTVTELLVGFGAANSALIEASVEKMAATGPKTPLAFALAAARNDLAGIDGERRIVLISDGNDTCEGDPVAEAAALGDLGVPLDIVGIGAMRRIPQHEQMAAANGLGSYSQARNGNQMNEALSGAGGENMVKIAIAEALKGKRIMLLPMGGGGLDVRSTDINSLLQLYGIQRVAQPSMPAQAAPEPVTPPATPANRQGNR